MRDNSAPVPPSLLEPWGYRVVPAQVTGCLHLKSAVTTVGNRLLINRGWTNPSACAAEVLIDVADEEPFGANALLVRDSVIYVRRIAKAEGRGNMLQPVFEF